MTVIPSLNLHHTGVTSQLTSLPPACPSQLFCSRHLRREDRKEVGRCSLPHSFPGNWPCIFQLQKKDIADPPVESGLSSWAAAPPGASSRDTMRSTQSSGEDTATNFQLIHLWPAVTTVMAQQKPCCCWSRKTSGATISFRAVQPGSHVPQHTPRWSRGEQPLARSCILAVLVAQWATGRHSVWPSAMVPEHCGVKCHTTPPQCRSWPIQGQPSLVPNYSSAL